MVASACASWIPRYFLVALYWGIVGGLGEEEEEVADDLLTFESSVAPPLWGGTPCGLWNWHCLVSECSYSVRPSGSCVVFHFIASASCWAAAVEAVVDGRSGAELAVASLRRCWFST